jgi:hypothetical protein
MWFLPVQDCRSAAQRRSSRALRLDRHVELKVINRANVHAKSFRAMNYVPSFRSYRLMIGRIYISTHPTSLLG